MHLKNHRVESNYRHREMKSRKVEGDKERINDVVAEKIVKDDA